MNIRNVAKFKNSARVFIVVYEENRQKPDGGGLCWYETIMYLDEPRREILVEVVNSELNDICQILTDEEKKPWESAIARAENVIARLASEHAGFSL